MKLTRREFLAGVSAGVVGTAIGMSGAVGQKPGEKQPRSKVVIARDADAMDDVYKVNQDVVQSMVDKALMELSGRDRTKDAWEKYIKPSDIVGVKANVMMAATHPEVIRAIVTRLIDIGVKNENIIIWDRDNAGIGVEGITKRKRHFGYDGKTHLSKIITDHCTILINVPGMKAHWLAGIAVALKNWTGVVRGINVGDRDATYAFHSDNCAELSQFNAMPVIRDKCQFVLVDALLPLCDKGPQVNPRYLWPYRGVLASTDPVAVDTVCQQIIQERRDEMDLGPISPPVKHITPADTKYNLGVSDPDQIDLAQIG